MLFLEAKRVLAATENIQSSPKSSAGYNHIMIVLANETRSAIWNDLARETISMQSIKWLTKAIQSRSISLQAP